MDIILNISANQINIISSTEKVVFEDVKDMREIWEILSEVFDMLDPSILSSTESSFGVKLIVTNDTSITKVEEW